MDITGDVSNASKSTLTELSKDERLDSNIDIAIAAVALGHSFFCAFQSPYTKQLPSQWSAIVYEWERGG